MKFVDANIFLRLITGDDPAKALRCKSFFQRLQDGEEKAATSEAIIAEIVYVLSGRTRYAMPRVAIAETLISLLSFEALAVSGKEAITQALELYSLTSLDFADALAAAHVLHDGLDGVLSYDKGYDRLGVPRSEP